MRTMRRGFGTVGILIALGAITTTSRATGAAPRDDAWPSYNRTLDGQRYSPLEQITPQNVARLKPVCEL